MQTKRVCTVCYHTQSLRDMESTLTSVHMGCRGDGGQKQGFGQYRE